MHRPQGGVSRPKSAHLHGRADMVAIEVNGVRVEAGSEKEAKRELSRLLKAERKAMQEREAKHAAARQKAEASAYRFLCWKAKGEECRRAFRLYQPGEQWAEHIFRECARDMEGQGKATEIQTQGGWVTLDHYGNEFLGATCNGGGLVSCVVLRDRYNGETTVYAIGTEEGELALAEVPGIGPEWFPRKD